MRIAILGLTLSSAWGNGHATTYRALTRALAARGHEIVFLERDKPWYADNRDLVDPDWCRLAFYDSLDGLDRWHSLVCDADAVIVGSYVPEGIAVGDHVLRTARGVRAFYDIDTPVTLAALGRGACDYLARGQIARYDIYLSFTGGPTLARLEGEYGSPAARALFCAVDTAAYRPTGAARRWDLSYLGTYSPDRQPKLDALLVEPARRAPHLRFVVAGAQYPDADWPANIERIDHCPPQDHADFYSASRYTLNLTRDDMVAAGWSPSVRLFEAAACACPVLSDAWPGIEALFKPGREIMLVRTGDEVLDALGQDAVGMGLAAQVRVLLEHDADVRARQLEAHIADAAARRTQLLRAVAARR